MTDEEASKLRCGERVEALYARTWYPVLVIAPLDPKDPLIGVSVRRVGSRSNGIQYPAVRRWEGYIRRIEGFAPTDANVFADWLEEHGEPRAAAMLREAFPFCEGKPTRRR